MKKIFALYDENNLQIGVYNVNWDAWKDAFDYQDEDFRKKYWKKPQASRYAMRKLGWKVVKGKFVKCK